MKRASWVALGLAALVALPLLLGAGPRIAASLLDSNLAHPEAIAAAPSLRLDVPGDGDGVNLTVRVAGQAQGDVVAIRDVQVRIDGGAWQSLPDAPTGVALSAFASEVALTAGPHLVEARATDGSGASPIASARVLAGSPAPPSITIQSPRPGAGVAAGDVEAAGTAQGAQGVVVRWDDGPESNATLAGAAWRANASLTPGAHTLAARAIGAGGTSLTARTDFLVGTATPPSLVVLQPTQGASFGSAGDAICTPRCIEVAGVASGASRVAVSIDGGSFSDATLAGASWAWPLSTDPLFSGAHRVAAVAFDAAGVAGLPQSVDVLVRTPRQLVVTGDESPQLTQSPLQFRVSGVATASWRLDDAPLGDGPTAAFSLASPGPHRLSLVARDAQGRSGSLSVPLFALDRPPIASLRGSSHGLEASFHAAAQDVDGRVVAFAWDFGDGAKLATRDGDIKHRYAADGVFTASVTAEDDSGAVGPSTGIRIAVTAAGPVANFSWSPDSPTVRDVVTFADASLSDATGPLLRSWSFDDGVASAPSNGSVTTHQFATRGPHAVALRVTDARGLVSTDTQSLVVANLPPEPAFSWLPAAPTPGEAVSFADQTAKPDGVLVGRAWDFGDGATATGAGPVHTYSTTGAFVVTLTVTDDMGAVASITHQLVVVDATLHVNAVRWLPDDPRSGDPVRFTLDADALPSRVLWQFGDNASSTQIAPLHAFANHGNYSGNVTAVDDAGHIVFLEFRVMVAPQPPRVNVTLGNGGYAQFPTTLVGNLTAAEGKPIRYAFDMDGDGSPECVGAEPRCRVVYPKAGTYTALLTVTDDAGANATGGLAVSILPPPSSLAPPALDVRQPRPADQLHGIALLVGSASGPHGVEAVEVQLRRGAFALSPSSSPWAAATGTDSWTLQLDTRPYPDGDYDLAIRARDANEGENLTLIPITLANGLAAPEVTVALTDVPAKAIHEATLLHGAAYHPAGVTAVRYQIDGGAWQAALGTPLAFRIPIDPAQFARGDHALIVEASHGINDRAIATATFRIGGDAPRLVVDDVPTAVSYGLFHAAGRLVGAGHVEYRIDEGVWTPALGNATWSVNADSESLPNGRHELSLRAVGPDATSEPVTYATRVLNPPTPDIAAPATAPSVPTRATPWPIWTLAVVVGFALLRRRA